MCNNLQQHVTYNHYFILKTVKALYQRHHTVLKSVLLCLFINHLGHLKEKKITVSGSQRSEFDKIFIIFDSKVNFMLKNE